MSAGPRSQSRADPTQATWSSASRYGCEAPELCVSVTGSSTRTRRAVDAVHLQDVILQSDELFTLALFLALIARYADIDDAAEVDAAREEQRGELDERGALADQDGLCQWPLAHARFQHLRQYCCAARRTKLADGERAVDGLIAAHRGRQTGPARGRAPREAPA